MSAIWIILTMAVAVYALRLSGFLLASGSLARGGENVLQFVPVATLSALIVSGLAARPAEGTPRLLALLAGALAARRSGAALLCILGGMAAYWLLRLL
ncbi:MAG TPA: AzlD domain-containing protein [Dehalococcoidia bacterium]|nr:AzlD domain-containing protein [Dehalococcoidia bacterium]